MNPLRKWFIYLHGIGEVHQYDLYRCMMCGRIVTHNVIKSGECCCSGKIGPTNPTWWETIKLLVFPWMI